MLFLLLFLPLALPDSHSTSFPFTLQIIPWIFIGCLFWQINFYFFNPHERRRRVEYRQMTLPTKYIFFFSLFLLLHFSAFTRLPCLFILPKSLSTYSYDMIILPVDTSETFPLELMFKLLAIYFSKTRWNFYIAYTFTSVYLANCNMRKSRFWVK